MFTRCPHCGGSAHILDMCPADYADDEERQARLPSNYDELNPLVMVLIVVCVAIVFTFIGQTMFPKTPRTYGEMPSSTQTVAPTSFPQIQSAGK